MVRSVRCCEISTAEAVSAVAVAVAVAGKVAKDLGRVWPPSAAVVAAAAAVAAAVAATVAVAAADRSGPAGSGLVGQGIISSGQARPQKI